MTIAEMRERSNRVLGRIPKDVLVVGAVVLASTASFGLGILAGRDMGAGKSADTRFWIEDASATTTARLPAAVGEALPPVKVTGPKIQVVPVGTIVTPEAGKYVASKTGKKYYLPSCSGANRIKEANKIWFATLADAQASGRTPAANCPGL